jgi:hypothetical protein
VPPAFSIVKVNFTDSMPPAAALDYRVSDTYAQAFATTSTGRSLLNLNGFAALRGRERCKGAAATLMCVISLLATLIVRMAKRSKYCAAILSSSLLITTSTFMYFNA